MPNCTGTSTYGPNSFQITSNASKPKVGQLTLTYTLSNGLITDACISYNPQNGNNSQQFAVTFTGTAPAYSGTLTDQPLQNPWNVPGEPGYKYGTFSFTPPTSSNANGSLTGTASKSPILTDDTINWESDPGVGQDEDGKEAQQKAAHPGEGY